MTEFYGDTLIEVFRKALGMEPARDPRFQPLGRKDFEPTELTGHELQVFLRPMRDAAVSRAQSYLQARYNPEDREEIGYSEFYNRNNGRHLQWRGSQAGTGFTDRRTGNKHFKFNLPSSLGWEILVLGHSHPRSSDYGTRGFSSTADDENPSPDDKDLNKYGPMVIATPERSWPELFEDGRPYRSFDEQAR